MDETKGKEKKVKEKMPEVALKYYIRDKSNCSWCSKGNPIATLVSTAPGKIGIAICNPVDNFSKLEGTKLALANEKPLEEFLKELPDKLPNNKLHNLVKLDIGLFIVRMAYYWRN